MPVSGPVLVGFRTATGVGEESPGRPSWSSSFWPQQRTWPPAHDGERHEEGGDEGAPGRARAVVMGHGRIVRLDPPGPHG
jgi:hypothetical protein